jgi:hypothetical protein
VKILLFALALAAGIAVRRIALAADSLQTSRPDFQTLELKVLSADGRQTIGSTSFTISSDGSIETIKGDTRYLDGDHDNEKARVQIVNGALRLDRYEHSFFSADGALTMFDKLDAASRIASCSRREDGAMKVRTAEFDFPADTFGGGSQLLMVIANLRAGRRKIDFHAFACVPGPRVFKVAVTVPDRTER